MPATLLPCCRHDKEDGHSYVEGAIKISRGDRDEVWMVFVFALFSHTQITRAIVARGIRRSVGETRSPWQRSSCTRAGQSALPFLDFLHTFKTDAAIQVQPKKVARVELPPMPPAEAKKFLIEASFMTTPAFAVICRFDVTFRSCIAARPLAMACAV